MRYLITNSIECKSDSLTWIQKSKVKFLQQTHVFFFFLQHIFRNELHTNIFRNTFLNFHIFMTFRIFLLLVLLVVFCGRNDKNVRYKRNVKNICRITHKKKVYFVLVFQKCFLYWIHHWNVFAK